MPTVAPQALERLSPVLSEPEPVLNPLQAYVLALNAKIRNTLPRDLVVWAFDALQPTLPHDGALWMSGTFADGHHQINAAASITHRISHDALATFNAASHLDPRGPEMFTHPGQAFIRDAHDLSDTPLAMRQQVFDPFNIRHGLLVQMMAPGSHIVHGVVLVRHPTSPAFTQDHARTVEALLPHWHQAFTTAALKAANDEVDGIHRVTYHCLLASPEGQLIAADPDAVAAAAQAWPAWQGGTLPPALQGASAAVLTPTHVFRVFASAHQTLVRVRTRNVSDTLTPRELVVAERFAAGDTYKRIAMDLGLAPATVRNHLSNSYDKLGVRDKAALAQVLLRLR
jgi:DNA-binding CsgD family transcriptional regulator